MTAKEMPARALVRSAPKKALAALATERFCSLSTGGLVQRIYGPEGLVVVHIGFDVAHICDRKIKIQRKPADLYVLNSFGKVAGK